MDLIDRRRNAPLSVLPERSTPSMLSRWTSFLRPATRLSPSPASWGAASLVCSDDSPPRSVVAAAGGRCVGRRRRRSGARRGGRAARNGSRRGDHGARGRGRARRTAGRCRMGRDVEALHALAGSPARVHDERRARGLPASARDDTASVDRGVRHAAPELAVGRELLDMGRELGEQRPTVVGTPRRLRTHAARAEQWLVREIDRRRRRLGVARARVEARGDHGVGSADGVRSSPAAMGRGPRAAHVLGRGRREDRRSRRRVGRLHEEAARLVIARSRLRVGGMRVAALLAAQPVPRGAVVRQGRAPDAREDR